MTRGRVYKDDKCSPILNKQLQEKLLELKAKLDIVDINKVEEIKKRIVAVESKYVLLSADTQIDSNVIVELNLIDNMILDATDTSCLEVRYLRDTIKKYVQYLCQLPVPLPSDFDQVSYNAFVNNRAKQILSDICNINDRLELMNIFSEMKIHKISFMKEHKKGKLQQALHIVNNSTTATLDAHTDYFDQLNCQLKQDILKVEIKDDVLDAIVERVIPKVISKDAKVSKLSEKDMLVLYEVFNKCDDKSLYIAVATVIGLSEIEATLLYDSMVIDKKKKENNVMIDVPETFKFLGF